MNPVALERAEKGLAWLKESGLVYGLDVNQVSIRDLDLASSCQCVLGQLGNDYAQVTYDLERAGVINVDERTARRYHQGDTWMQEHGFEQVPYSHEAPDRCYSYKDLDAAWTRLLRADRAEQNRV